MSARAWTFSLYTTATGAFTRRLPAGVFTVTSSSYGFLPAVVAGVEVVKDGVTTQNFALTPARTYFVDGVVADRLTGWPLYAAIEIEGYPGGTIWTDPATGRYRVQLVAGMGFNFRVSALVAGYLAAGQELDH